jgi:beta-glucosidase
MDVVDSPKHREFARRAAAESIVLLKNKNNVLPLSKNIHKLAVTGPHAASVQVLMGNYYGLSPKYVTVLEGLMDRVSPTCSVEYVQGCLDDRAAGGTGGAVWISQWADACVVVMGLSNLFEGEEGEALNNTHGGDRTDIRLPPNQIDFLKELRKGVKKPLIVVLTGGGPIACPEVEELADAVLMAWYPGEEGGAAVADVIFGDINPSGRLPITFPKSLDQLPAFEDYAMSGSGGGKGRTYRYMKEEPLWPFGFGLSYAKFEYRDLHMEPVKLTKNGIADAHFTIENTGKVAGDEVVQLYITAPSGTKDAPRASLKALRRVHLEAGAKLDVTMRIGRDMFTLVDEKGDPTWLSGSYTIHIGGCSPGSRGEALGATKLLSGSVSLN